MLCMSIVLLQCAVVHETYGSREGSKIGPERIPASIRNTARDFDQSPGQLREGSRAAVGALVEAVRRGPRGGKENLAGIFEWAFYEQISNATAGHLISFLQEDEREGQNSGLMLLTFGSGQFDYASAFLTAIGRLRGGEDAGVRTKAQKSLDALVKSVFPEMKPPGKKRE
jgi:hypothetical protein